MPELDDIAARLAALETVVKQLIMHMAIGAENPLRWVQTRKVLALNAIARTPGHQAERIDRINHAITGLFHQIELVIGDDGAPTRRGTHRHFVR